MSFWTHKAGVSGSFHAKAGSLFQVVAGGSFGVGDLIVVAVSCGNTGGSMNITNVYDSLGNVYTSPSGFTQNYNAGSGGGSSSALVAVYFSVVTAPGTPTIYVSTDKNTNWGMAMVVDGFTGTANASDVIATFATGAYNVTPASNTTGTTTNGNELGFSVYADMGGGALEGAPSTWTLGVNVQGTTDNNIGLFYKDAGATGSTVNAGSPLTVATSPGQPWGYICAVLKLGPVLVSDTVTIADTALSSQPANTTPQTSDAVTVRETASVTVATDSTSSKKSTVAPSWAAWQPRKGVYTFYLADLATNTLLDVLPFTECTFTRLLNRAGTFSAKLPLGDRVRVPDPVGAISHTTPETTVLYVDKGGQMVFSGSILTRSYDLASDVLTIQGQDLYWWLTRNNIETNLSYNEDMIQIARDLVSYAQGLSQGNLLIQVNNSAGAVFSGNVITRNYLGANSAGAGAAPVIGKMIEELAALNPGFEFRVRSTWQGGQPIRQFQVAWPYFGVASANTQYVWSYPSGAITAMTWPEDATATARRIIALGTQQSDGTRPVAYSSQPVAYPRTTETLTFSVDGVNDLQPLADAQQILHANPTLIPAISVYGPQDPIFGTYWEGDHARYHVHAGTSGRFWNGLDQVWRIIGLEVNVRKDGTETVTHQLAPAVF